MADMAGLVEACGASSDISEDEAKIDMVEQKELERLEAALDRTFCQTVEQPYPDDAVFDDPIDDAYKLFDEAHEDLPNLNNSKPFVRTPTKKSKAKRVYSIEDGRKEIEKRLNEMKRAEIDQVKCKIPC